MAKQALLDVLEQTIGKYVLNLDAESLNVAVWSGKIELNSLLLNCDAVNAELARQAAEAPNLAIPFKVVSGVFENFQVEVPWTQIMYRPVVLRASGLSISVEPFNPTTSSDYLQTIHESETARARHVEEQRDKSLQLANNYREQTMALRNLAAQDLEASSSQTSQASANNSTFATRLVRRIIENLQIEITDVTVIVQGADCSAGITLNSLSLVTTDGNGKPTFVDRSSGTSSGNDLSFLYKALTISGLGLYLDEERSTKAFLTPISENAVNQPLGHSYVLAPLSFVANLRQADSNQCVDYPKYLLASELDSLSVSLSKSQLELASKIAEQLSPSPNTPLFPEYRPQKRVTKETTLIWWRYAVRCVGRLSGRRLWVEFYRAFQLRKAYIPLYKRHIHHDTCQWLNVLATWEVAQMRLIERDRTISVDGIMAWRTIADAQAQKEKEKRGANQAKAKGSIFSSLFGSVESASRSNDEAPITLTVEELKALESITAVQAVDSELSIESQLCDMKFVLGSLRINLSSYDERPIVSLEMGAVSTSFDARQDGSFACELVLTSLEIQDRVTPKTYFPLVLKNQTTNNSGGAFVTRYSKTNTGDQHFMVKLSTFEAVASPTLLVEVKQFVALPKHRIGASAAVNANAILAQSVSGSVDLFYDATEGSDRKEDPFGLTQHEAVASAALSDVSNALVSAWKSKSESKASWIIDLDIQAPILVVPESCTGPRANVLVFDFGNLKFTYGTPQEASAKVEAWYREHRKTDSLVAPILDYGSVRISRLTFSLGNVDNWRNIARSDTGEIKGTIIDPISLSVDFGVESAVDQSPRLCAVGVLPSIALLVSPSQMVRIMQVLKALQRTLNDMKFEEDSPMKSIETSSTQQSSNLQYETTLAAAQHATPTTPSGCLPFLYVGIQLQRLSVKILDETGDGIEGHLVSASVSLSQLSNGSSVSRLAMGWFWMLDRCRNDFPRRQRLIAHSTLPLSPEELAKDEMYDVMNELAKRGVFLDTYEGSVDLAEITLSQIPLHTPIITANIFAESQLYGAKIVASSMLVASFTRLFIVWNPRAVKTMAGILDKFARSLELQTETEGIVITSPGQLSQARRLSLDSTRSKAESKPSGIMSISATMDGLHISLNSARDDLPLFNGTMASTRLSVISSESNMRLDLVIGELNVETPSMGKTAAMYKNIFGLVPGESESLLSIRYFSGPMALEHLSSTNSDVSGCEAYGDAELSPMRMVYVQAQFLTLIEYATAGILGAVTAQAATSAANAAVDLATASGSKKIFLIRARSFNLVLPQSAYRSAYLSASLGVFDVKLTMLPDTSTDAQISLQDVLIQDNLANELIEKPVRMDISVLLRPEGVGTKDDQAMMVNIAISEAHFALTHKQYCQLLATLDDNIGEIDLFVREDSTNVNDSIGEHLTREQTSAIAGLTHAGVEIVQEPRRLYLNVTIATLALSLLGVDKVDPILRLSADDAIILLRSLVDVETMEMKITLRDMTCEDIRLKALARQYRSLIYQPSHSDEHHLDVQDVFYLSYETSGDASSTIDVKLGSPRIVFIPDVVSDVLEFLSVDRTHAQSDVNTERRVVAYHEVVEVDADITDSGIEASFMQEEEPCGVNRLVLSFSTLQCSLLMVDLGSDVLRSHGQASLSVASLAETVVFGGVLEAKLSMETEKMTGNTASVDLQMHSDHVEVYSAFGRDLCSAIQILDPTQFSLYVNSNAFPGKTKTLDVRCAVISPIDVTLSMRNVALLNAIVSSISDTFDQPETKLDKTTPSMSQEETNRIEYLAKMLESEASDLTVNDRDLTENDDSSDSNKPSIVGTDIGSERQFKLTTPQISLTLVNDLQGLDEALVRISVRNIVANGRMQTDVSNGGENSTFTSFDFNFNTTAVADFFDASSNSWKVLLIDPWELSAKCSRGVNRRFQSIRPSTTVDIESLPCHISFSEKFLMSLASANRMWSVYSSASSSALESLDRESQESKVLKRSIAASAARTFISSLPYAVENHTGLSLELVVNGEKQERRTCDSGSLEYFVFDPPASQGSGGQRLYGQDVTFDKAITLVIGNCCVLLPHLDSLLGEPKQSHVLESCSVVMTEVVREGKTIVIHVSSGIDVYNHSLISFAISVVKDGAVYEVGTCNGLSARQLDVKQSLTVQNGRVSKQSSRFGIPVDLMKSFRSDFASKADSMIGLNFSPQISCPHDGWQFNGGMKLRMKASDFTGFQSGVLSQRHEITCRPIHPLSSNASAPRDMYAFVFQARVSMTLANGKDPVIDIFIEPRALIRNKIPISVTIKTPMPHVFSVSSRAPELMEESIHTLEQNGCIEVYTPGPSIAVMAKCSDIPVGGTATDWMEGGWIDLPLESNFRMQDPIHCLFPFIRKPTNSMSAGSSRGVDFIIAEGSSVLNRLTGYQGSDANRDESTSEGVELVAPPSIDDDWSTFFITVHNYAVDHTGDILFEQLKTATNKDVTLSPRTSGSLQMSPSIGAFSGGRHRGRISLLPGLHVPIRLLHLSMEGNEGVRRSLPFCVDDISICDGGMDSSAVKWMNGAPSGFFAYRKLVSSYQSEIHVIPEFIVFNGSAVDRVCIHQAGGLQFMIPPGMFAPLRRQAQESAIVSVEYPDLDCRSRPVRIDTLGLRVAVLKSTEGFAIGSISLQTVVGSRDSKFVVKLGGIKSGSTKTQEQGDPNSHDWLRDDFLRLRIKWTELEMTLTEARPMSEKKHAILESALDRIQSVVSPAKSERSAFGLGTPTKSETWVDARQRYSRDRPGDLNQVADAAVCTIFFGRFTVDWQRVFKENDTTYQRSATEALESTERAQLAVVIHHVRIRDETPNSPYPIVFDSTSQKVPFFDALLRLRGESSPDIVAIDLLELNLAYHKGVTEKIYLNTNEDFVWKVLDLADRILVAMAEFAGVDIQLNWDDEHDGYVVGIREKISAYNDDETKYEPPQSDTIYHIKKTRVSPFTCVVSFRRNPNASRYKIVRGGHVVNYFTRQLKFKIDKAELHFASYEVSDVKGPPDHILDLISTVYMSRMKAKIWTIVTASSFQDWKFLASRDGGDGYKEGDILRATGNVAGSTANYIFKNAGVGLGSGVRNVASSVGDGIESATEAIGVHALGAGVNSVVSGVGDGVGATISGVGSGTGKVFKSMGQGAGQVVGGFTGGLMLVGKGIGKGITSGDGSAVASGLMQGTAAIGNGVGQGLESVVTGTVDGVVSVGQGFFSGVRSVGKGIGGAITECCGCFSCCTPKEEVPADRRPGVYSPLLPRHGPIEPYEFC